MPRNPRSKLVGPVFALAAMGLAGLLIMPAVAGAANASVVISAPQANATVGGSVAIAAVCTAGTGRTISSVKYWIDSGQITDMVGTPGSTVGTWTSTWNSASVADGTHSIYVRAYQDNGSSVTSSVRITVNNTSLSISMPSTTTLNAAVDVTMTTGLGITVKSPGLSWGMTIQKNHDLQSGSLSIPSSRLTFTSLTTGSGTVVSTPTQVPTSPPAAVLSGASPTTGSGVIVTVRYAYYQTYDDAPTTYTATHTFVVTSQ